VPSGLGGGGCFETRPGPGSRSADSKRRGNRPPVATDLDVAEHVELRGEGSITVIPPSVHPSGCRYRIRGYPAGILVVDDAHAWLRDLLMRLGIKPKEKGNRSAIDPTQLLAQPIYETSPGRNMTLTRIGGYLHNRLPPDWTSAVLHAINDARCEPPPGGRVLSSMCRRRSLPLR